VSGIDKSLRWLFLVLSVFAFAACAKRTVYVPPDWQAPPPRQQTVGQQGRQKPPSPAPERAPILKPAPSIKESDITSSSESETPQQPEKTPASPQRLASMHLIDQANAALAQGKTDAAISRYEQAIQVDVYNGDAFFGLARAWRTKGSMVKASEFARKAEILYQDKPEKLKQVYLFEADIFKELGDSSKAEAYRMKASRL
jgi:Tfp pilus assembly protein PilF/predicted small lipoprotein YifL